MVFALPACHHTSISAATDVRLALKWRHMPVRRHASAVCMAPYSYFTLFLFSRLLAPASFLSRCLLLCLSSSNRYGRRFVRQARRAIVASGAYEALATRYR